MDKVLKLKNEIQNDPLEWGYSGLPDSGVLSYLNNSDNQHSRTFILPIDSNELLAWGGDNFRALNLKSAAENGVDFNGNPIDNQTQNISIVGNTMLFKDTSEIDLRKPDRRVMVDVLVSGNILTDFDKNSLFSLVTHTGSRAQELELVDIDGELFLGHVKQARSLI